MGPGPGALLPLENVAMPCFGQTVYAGGRKVAAPKVVCAAFKYRVVRARERFPPGYRSVGRLLLLPGTFLNVGRASARVPLW